MMSEYNAKKQYNDFLDEVYGMVKVGPYEYPTSQVMLEVDPIAYDEGFSIWVDSEKLEVEGF